MEVIMFVDSTDVAAADRSIAVYFTQGRNVTTFSRETIINRGRISKRLRERKGVRNRGKRNRE
jgi:hypothetical protein